MHVEEVDARTAPDLVLDRFVAIEHACGPETNPGEPLRLAAEAAAFYRHQPTTHTSCLWLCGGGSALLSVHGPTAAFLRLLVAPAERRRGIGSALLAAVVARCRELDVHALHSSHTRPAGAAFAARHRFVDGQRVRARPARPACDDGLGAERARGLEARDVARARSGRAARGVRRLARSAMDDAPAPEEMDFPTGTAEKVRASEESACAARSARCALTVAMRSSGEIGAFTELRVSRGSTLGFTDDTGTVAARRGLGLARAVKLESLRLLRRDHPELEVV